MLGLFKKKTAVDKLDDQFRRLMKESHSLSTTDRRASDAKAAEADQILKQIEKLESKN